MYVCCPFYNRTTIGQQSDNKRTTVGGRIKEGFGKDGDNMECDMTGKSRISVQLENIEV